MDLSDRIYVAGHTGLVGSAILRLLRSRGFAHLLTRTRTELDLTNENAVARFFREERPRHVFLAAARVGGIRENALHPAEFLEDNLRIELNVLRSALESRVRRLLFLASTCVYPKHAEQPMRPEQLLTGPIEPTNEPYAVAKICGIRLVQAYRKEYGADFAAAIAANSYGPGDHFDDSGHVISSLMARIHQAKLDGADRVEAWGTGNPRREFLYVDDFADACLHLMNLADLPEIVNIGSGEEYAIADLAGRVREAVGFEGEILFDATKPDGMPRRLLDSAPLRSSGWAPRVGLDQGLAETYRRFAQRPTPPT